MSDWRPGFHIGIGSITMEDAEPEFTIEPNPKTVFIRGWSKPNGEITIIPIGDGSHMMIDADGRGIIDVPGPEIAFPTET